METTCFASGARRSRAAAAVVNSLGAVDLVAAIVAEDAQVGVTEAVRRELEAQECVRVFDLGTACSPDLPDADAVADDDRRHRDVYLWGGVDAAIRQDPEEFEHVVEELCGALSTDDDLGRNGRTARRVVIIGGDPLMERLDHLIHGIRRGVRYRYILVQ